MIGQTTANEIEPALSIFSHVPVRIPGKRNRDKWPQVNCDGVPTSLTCARKVVLMGGRRLWAHRSLDDSFTWDAWWSITPRRVWKCLISDTLPPGGSMNGGLTPSSDDQGIGRDPEHLLIRTIFGSAGAKVLR